MKWIVLSLLACFAVNALSDVLVVDEKEKRFIVLWAEKSSTVHAKSCISVPSSEAGNLQSCAGKALPDFSLTDAINLLREFYKVPQEATLSDVSLQAEKLKYQLEFERVLDKASLEAEKKEAERLQIALTFVERFDAALKNNKSALEITEEAHPDLVKHLRTYFTELEKTADAEKKELARKKAEETRRKEAKPEVKDPEPKEPVVSTPPRTREKTRKQNPIESVESPAPRPQFSERIVGAEYETPSDVMNKPFRSDQNARIRSARTYERGGRWYLEVTVVKRVGADVNLVQSGDTFTLMSADADEQSSSTESLRLWGEISGPRATIQQRTQRIVFDGNHVRTE